MISSHFYEAHHGSLLSLSLLVVLLSLSSPTWAQPDCNLGTAGFELFLVDQDFSIDIRVYLLDGSLFGTWNSTETKADDHEDCSWAADATGDTYPDHPTLPSEEPFIIEFERADGVGAISRFTYFVCGNIPDPNEFYCPNRSPNGPPPTDPTSDVVFHSPNISAGGRFVATQYQGFSLGAANDEWILPYTFGEAAAEGYGFFMSGQSPVAPSGSWPTYVAQDIHFYDGLSATWDLDGGGLDIGKFGVLSVEGDLDLGDFTLKSGQTGGGDWDLDVTGSLAITGSASIEDGLLRFADGKQLVVEGTGTLDADGTMFQELYPSQGWGGLHFESGSSGAVTESTIEDVQASNSVYVYNADVDFVDTQIRNGSGTGLRVSGSQANVTFGRSTSPSQFPLIDDHSSGIMVTNGAEVHVEEAVISNSGPRGVYAYNADLYLFESEVTGSDGFGASAEIAGYVAYGSPTRTPIGENNVLDDHTAGTFYGLDWGTHYAGTGSASAYGGNSFYRDVGTNQLHAEAVAADVIAECNYWGTSSGPDASYVSLADGGTFDGTPYLAAAGGSQCSGGILSRSATGAERGEGFGDGDASGPPEEMDPLRWDALRSAHEGERPAAFGLLVQAVQTAATPDDAARAYGALAQLGSQGGAPPSLGAFLTAQAARADERPWALTALAALRFAEGDAGEAVASARALTAEYGGSEHARRGWSALHAYAVEAGDEGAASEALAALEAGWPEHPATTVAREEHALHYGAGEGARAETAGPAARAGGAAESEEEAGPGAFALGAAYPNPANGSVTVPLVLDATADVRLVVYDVLGREVAVLANGALDAGPHEATLDASGLPSGVYLVRLTAGNRVATQRVTVLR